MFDLGGGTFDVSVLEIGDGVFEVKSTHGDTHLGGDDWDQRVIDWLVDSFKTAHGVDLSKDNMAMQRLKEAAEKAKIELSQVQQTQINLPFITATADGPLHLDEQLTRAKFQELTPDLLDRCKMPFEQAIKDAGLTKGDIDHVILVGGSTRMPAVAELVKEMTGKDPHKGVNPDEVVAIGAAVQAGVLKGEVKDVLLLDVTPLSLGIETKGGVMTKLIERNTTIPTRRTEVFTTAEDNQPSVEIHVLQGEREMANFNKTLGKFQLVDLPPAPRGVPQIEVTFDIDANGIVHVSAKDRATSKEQSMTITGQSSLSKDAIHQMVKDAEAHAEEDRQRKEEAEMRNPADTLVYQTEKLLRDQGDKISAEEKANVESKLADLKTAARRHRPRGHQVRHRAAHDRQPGVHPEALRAGGRQRLGRRDRRSRQLLGPQRRRRRRRRDRRRRGRGQVAMTRHRWAGRRRRAGGHAPTIPRSRPRPSSEEEAAAEIEAELDAAVLAAERDEYRDTLLRGEGRVRELQEAGRSRGDRAARARRIGARREAAPGARRVRRRRRPRGEPTSSPSPSCSPSCSS